MSFSSVSKRKVTTSNVRPANTPFTSMRAESPSSSIPSASVPNIATASSTVVLKPTDRPWPSVTAPVTTSSPNDITRVSLTQRPAGGQRGVVRGGSNSIARRRLAHSYAAIEKDLRGFNGLCGDIGAIRCMGRDEPGENAFGFSRIGRDPKTLRGCSASIVS